MVDLETRVMQLSGQGYGCSQIMVILALEMGGRENYELVRAMHALRGGMGRFGDACGAMTGGCAAIGIYTGKGAPDETARDDVYDLVREFAEWFDETFGKPAGGTDCRLILKGDYDNVPSTCPPLILACAEKLVDMLMTYDLVD